MSELLNDACYGQALSAWLEENWRQSREETVRLEFEQLRRRIRILSLRSGARRLLAALSRAAAVLFVPLAALCMYVSRQEPAGLLTLSTQRGEQTALSLPDGSKVWLNVDTKLRYPADYGLKSRNVELEGEAYFEVIKNEKLPFRVTSGAVTTRAIGTRFLVSAYPEQSSIRSSLIRGCIEVSCKQAVHTIAEEGRQLVYHKDEASARILSFNQAQALAWKNNQLTFYLTPFDEVIAKLEKWYNVSIRYEPELFKSETLTVRFEHYETLEHVLPVMAKAHGFGYTVEDKTIVISKQKGGGEE